MKTTPSLRLLTIVGAVAFVLSAPLSQAILLDWDNLTWAPGNLSQTFTAADDPLLGAGSVTVSLAGDTAKILGITVGPPLYDGGTGQKALQIFQNFQLGQNVTITVSFAGYGSQGVTVDPFALFDVDKDKVLSWSTDQISGNQATLPDSSTITPTTITGSVANNVVGAVATGLIPAGDLTNEGNVTVAYASAGITQFLFNYAAGPGTEALGPQGGIALGDINFTPVPEAGTVAACAVVSLLGAWGLRRMRKVQPEPIES